MSIDAKIEGICKSSLILDFWETRDEVDNFEQNYDSKIVKEEKQVEVTDEVRIEVDALMREELKNLKAVCVLSLHRISSHHENVLFQAIDKTKDKKKKKKKKKVESSYNFSYPQSKHRFIFLESKEEKKEERERSNT